MAGKPGDLRSETDMGFVKFLCDGSSLHVSLLPMQKLSVVESGTNKRIQHQ